jgi:hypothetical protein
VATDQSDELVLGKIQKLVDEEHALYGGKDLDEHASARLKKLQVELDQCWDLLRQRRALREFGQDPDQAKVRSATIVEDYEQ